MVSVPDGTSAPSRAVDEQDAIAVPQRLSGKFWAVNRRR